MDLGCPDPFNHQNCQDGSRFLLRFLLFGCRNGSTPSIQGFWVDFPNQSHGCLLELVARGLFRFQVAHTNRRGSEVILAPRYYLTFYPKVPNFLYCCKPFVFLVGVKGVITMLGEQFHWDGCHTFGRFEKFPMTHHSHCQNHPEELVLGMTN